MQRSAVTLVALSTAFAASAAQAPRKGEETIVVDYVVTSATPLGREHRDDPPRIRVEFSGVSHEEAGGRLFDKLSLRCSGVLELGGEHGECLAADGDANRLSFAYASPAPGGAPGSSRLTFTGGAGKFAGLSGSDDGNAAAMPASPGLPSIFARERLVWRLAPRGAEVATTRPVK